MNVPIKNFIFDIDGTLIDTYQMYMPALAQVVAPLGIRLTAADLRLLYGVSAADALQALAVPRNQMAAVERDWLRTAYQHVDQVKVFAGVATTIQRLAQTAGTQLAIVTSKHRHEYEQYFAHRYAFARNFAVVVTADDTRQHKPHPAPLQLALRRLQATPAASLYVGDMPTDLAAAHAAGMRFAGADYGSVVPRKLALADIHLASPTDLLKC